MLTIIIPTLNAEQYIARLLDSIDAQTVTPRLLFVDGGSTDLTLKILEGREVVIAPGSTIYGAQNIGAQYVNDGYVYHMGADDWLENKRFVEAVLQYDAPAIQGKTRFSTLPHYSYGPRQQNFVYSRDILTGFNEANLVYADIEFRKSMPEPKRIDVKFCVVSPGGFSSKHMTERVVP